MYKLLALDMDGTTLTSDKKVSKKTLEAINRLINAGVHVIVASGRCLAEMGDYREDFKLMRYAVLASGALIYDFIDDKPVAVHPVPFDDCMDLIELGQKQDAMVHILTIKNSIAKPQDLTHMADFGMGVYTDMFNRICVHAEDLKKYALEHKEEVIKVNLYHRSPEARAHTVELLKGRDLQMVFAETTSLEASPPNVTKASGLIELCRFLNIDLADTVAIGDAPNDTEILQTVGCAVAMGNATDDIKKLANFVTADNDHDGVAVAIDKLFNA